MIYRTRFSATALCLLCLLTSQFPALAQTQVKTDNSQKRAATRDSSSSDSRDLKLKARRELATSMLISLADEARSFRDETLRVRIQARAAEVLWESDRERARALFRRSWEAAETADAESQLQFQGKTNTAPPSNLRGEVLLLTQLRDPALAEEFLAKLDKDREQREANVATSNSRQPPCPAPTDQLPIALSQRLGLALQLLPTGETQRAMQFAAPALDCVMMQSVSFLITLRTKNAATADQAYTLMLARAASNPLSDANTVSLLSSYVFTPFLFITVGPRGNFNTSAPPNLPPAPDLPPAVRVAFFRTAAQIFSRPLPPPDQDRTSAGRAGTYFVIKRLLPLFEQYSPDIAIVLRTALNSMAAEVSEGFRSGRSEWLTKGLVPDAQSGDDIENALNRASSMGATSDRDAIYINAVLRVYKNDYARALELIDKISNAEMRQQTLAFVDFNALLQATTKKDADELVRLARKGELTPLQRVIAFTEAAGLIMESDSSKAIELIDEAQTWARRIDRSSPDRGRALVATATQMFKIERERAWATMYEVVGTANAADGFTGRDSKITVEVRTKGNYSISDHSVPRFTLAGIFKDLARDDLNRAIEMARSFAGESPRALSTIAIARSVLEEKPKAKPTRQKQ